MKIRTWVATALCAAAVLIPVAPASASTVQTGGCSASRQLLPVSTVIERIDFRPYTAEERAGVEAQLASTDVDVNQDGRLCFRTYQVSPGRDKQWGFDNYVLSMIGDNAVPGR